MDTLDITMPFDGHYHLRRRALMELVFRYLYEQFQAAVIMPNTNPAIYTGEDIANYHREIYRITPKNIKFKPIMVLYITPTTTPAMVESAWQCGARAGKLYSKGGTTNSEDGIEYYFPLFPVFQKMAELGMLLLNHGEITRYENRYRELMFLPILDEIAAAFPKLKIVLEHISTFEGIEAVRRNFQRHGNVAGSLTIHHMVLTETIMMGEKFHVHRYWKPTPKQEHDRLHIIQAALSGERCFFFGSDSAAHDITMKHAAECCAGVLHVRSMEMLAEIFDRHNALDRLENFVSKFGPDWYGIKLDPTQWLKLVKKPCRVPETIQGYGHTVVPFRAGETIPWSIAK